MNTETHDLTPRERREFRGLEAREREIQALAQPLRNDWKEAAEEVEERLGIGKGAIGTTHMIDVAAGRVIPRPADPMQPPGASGESGPTPESADDTPGGEAGGGGSDHASH